MTSIFKTPHGEMQQFVQNLHTSGFTYEDITRVNKDSNLAATMYLAIQPKAFVAAGSIVDQVACQLKTWMSLGVVISDEQREYILQQAYAFEPATDTDEPLVTGGFGYNNPAAIVNKLISAFTPPQGYTKSNFLDGAELRYVSYFRPKGELRLVSYDPNAYAHLSPKDARKAAKRDGLRLAGIEVFEHLMLEPKTSLTWDGKLYYYPNASGLDRKYDGDWSGVPYVYLDGLVPSREFRFRSVVDAADVGWSSPVVREC